jgi:hypothetical protein
VPLATESAAACTRSDARCSWMLPVDAASGRYPLSF